MGNFYGMIMPKLYLILSRLIEEEGKFGQGKHMANLPFPEIEKYAKVRASVST